MDAVGQHLAGDVENWTEEEEPQAAKWHGPSKNRNMLAVGCVTEIIFNHRVAVERVAKVRYEPRTGTKRGAASLGPAQFVREAQTIDQPAMAAQAADVEAGELLDGAEVSCTSSP